MKKHITLHERLLIGALFTNILFAIYTGIDNFGLTSIFFILSSTLALITVANRILFGNTRMKIYGLYVGIVLLVLFLIFWFLLRT